MLDIGNQSDKLLQICASPSSTVYSPLHTKRQFVAARDRGGVDAVLGHASGQEVFLSSSDKLADDGIVPPGVNNGNAQPRT